MNRYSVKLEYRFVNEDDINDIGSQIYSIPANDVKEAIVLAKYKHKIETPTVYRYDTIHVKLLNKGDNNDKRKTSRTRRKINHYH